MAEILTWLSKYPLPIVILIAVAAAFLYLLKTITERSIAQQFGRYTKLIDLQLQRRSNFEEHVLMERFTLIRQIKVKIDNVFTNLFRMRQGTPVEGLFQSPGDLVPLTEVFQLLNANRYLIPKDLFKVLHQEADIALEYARAADGDAKDAVAAEVLSVRAEFDRLMDEEFALTRIRASD